MNSDKLVKKLITEEKYLEYRLSDEENAALSIVFDAAKPLRKSLNESQLLLFSKYAAAMVEYKSASERRAFSAGVRFAVEYFIEKSEDD